MLAGQWEVDQRLIHLICSPPTSPVLSEDVQPFQIAAISQIAVLNCLGGFQVCTQIVIPISSVPISPSSYPMWSQ